MLRNATQDYRQLAVFTPFGKDRLLLECFEGEEALSEISVFRLRMLSAEPDLDPRQILGQNVTVAAKQYGGETRYFNGYVNQFCQTEMTDRMYVYEAEVVPWLWFLTQGTDCRIFQDKTTPQIIKKVFRKAGYRDFDMSLLQGNYKPHEYCVQYRESHFDFVSRLMEEEGIFYYVRHENGGHQVVLADSVDGYYEIANDKVSIAAAADQGMQNLDVAEWKSGKQALAAKYVSTDYNFATPHTRLDSKVGTSINAIGSLGLEKFEYPGRYYQGSDGSNRVSVRIEEEEAKYEWASATGARDSFSPGGIFEVEQHSDHSQVGKRMCLRKVSYKAGKVGSYTSEQEPDTEHPWKVDFEAIPAATVFRPTRTTPLPIIDGPQTAVVVGPEGEQIHTDRHGRIKVQFHWDREGSKNEKSSCWIRVSQVHAGAGWGMMDLPRIGEEVIVSFLEGDPDRPIVKGRVYNGAVKPPFDLPGQMTRSGGKSNTHKGSGYNEMSADDTAGNEQIRANAQFNMDTTVGNSQTLQVGNDRSESIGNNDSLTVGVDKSMEVGTNLNEVVGNNENIIAGSNVELKAGVALTLKCGSSTIHMNQAGVITVSGQYVSSLARACNSIVAPMTEIAGSDYLNQGGLICLDLGGIKKINGNETSISSPATDVSGGTVVIKGAPIEIGVPGMKPASIPAPDSAGGGGGGGGPSGPASTGSGGSSASQGESGEAMGESIASSQTDSDATSQESAAAGGEGSDSDNELANSNSEALQAEDSNGSLESSSGPGDVYDLELLENSEGELAPENFETPSERSEAYAEHQKLHEQTGGLIGQSKFPQMASDVSDDLDGNLAELVYYSDETEEFLGNGNKELYDFNDKIFNEQRRNPNDLKDPFGYVDPNADLKKINDAFEYDLRMVETEQRFLSNVMDESLSLNQREKVIGELNASLKTMYQAGLEGGAAHTTLKHVFGNALGYESKAALGASVALGRNVDFSNEKDRIAIGHAAAFLAHGYSEQQYLDYMKTGKLPER